MKKLSEIWSKYRPVLIMVVFIIVAECLSRKFLTMNNIMNVLNQTSMNAILALGLTTVILTGGIDISVGSTLAFSGALAAFILKGGHSVLLAVPAALLVGLCIGMLNGIFISRWNLQPMIVTLATMSIFRGTTYLLTGGSPISVSNAAFKVIGGGKLFNVIQVPIVILLVLAIIMHYVLNNTPFGRHIYSIGSREETAQKLRSEYEAEGKSIDVRVLDVRDVPQIRPVFDGIAADYGHIDILINCAGMGHPIPAMEVTQEDWDTMMDLNLRGAFFCSQAAARHMLEKGSGHIVNITSQISLVANEGETVYCASKGGMNQMTRVLALEWGSKGVIVNAVAPTFTYTPGTAERLDQPEFRASVLARIPRGELGTIDDIASAVHYLVSGHADMASGSILVIDGGWTSV